MGRDLRRCYAPRAARSAVWRPWHVFTVRASGIGLYSVSRAAMPARVSGGKLALVFPGERGTPFSGWSKAKSALDIASGVSGWWLHDLRRTLATGLQRLGVRLEVTEAVLNHLSGSRAGVVGIYQRHDWAEEKRAALDAWSVHLLAAAEGRLPAGKVLPFSRPGSGEV
jgi:integrase